MTDAFDVVVVGSGSGGQHGQVRRVEHRPQEGDRGDLPAPDTQPLVCNVPAYLPGMEGRRTASR